MDLAFVRPSYLWGLLFLSVPLIVHLLDRRRTKTIDFSTTRFFGDSAIRTNRRHRITSLLLLAVRLLMIILLTAIFAQPFRTDDPFQRLGDPRATFYCWIDPTVSMDYRDVRHSIHGSARQVFDSLRSQAPAGARVNLFEDAAGEFREVAGPPLQGTRHGGSGMGEALSRFAAQGIRRDRLPVLVVISDFQDSGPTGVPGCLDTFFATTPIDFPVVCVSLAPDKPWNFGIVEAFFPPGNQTGLSMRLTAMGRPIRGARLTITSGGISAGQVSTDVAAGDSTLLEWPLAPELRGRATHVRLETQDPFPLDDVAWCSPQEQRSFRVLVLGDSDLVFPLATALRAVGGRMWNPVLVKAGRDAGYGDMDSADLIVVADVEGMTPAFSRRIQSSDGMRKAIIVSPFLDTSSAVFGAIPGSTPARPKLVSGDRSRIPVFADTISSLWQGFGRAGDVAVRRYLRNLPGTPLVSFDNGDPFALSNLDSNGNSWVLFTTPLHLDSANNLWQSGSYVALVDRCARYALGRVGGGEERWRAGVPHRNPCAAQGTACTVYRQDGSVAGRWSGIAQVTLDSPGLYRLAPDEGPSQWISVHTDPAETRFTYRPPTVPEQTRRFVLMVDQSGARTLVRNRKAGLSSDWLWMILAGLVLAEMALWGRPRLVARGR